MSTTQQRVVLSLVCGALAYGMAGPFETEAGLWDKFKRTTSREDAAAQQSQPGRNELRAFFTDDTPESFQLIGNEVSIEAPPALPEDPAPLAPPEMTPIPPASAPPAAVESAHEHTDFCTSSCGDGFHSWWCRHQQWWSCQSELSRERRLKNSRNLFKKSYYETFPAYHVENYGIYRTCWRKLPELDCCPEDVIAPKELVPAPDHFHK